MDFKFKLGERVVVPGSKGLQGIIIGRKEFFDAEAYPEYELRWLGDDAAITSGIFAQDQVDRVQPGFITSQFALHEGVHIVRVTEVAKPKRPKRKSKLKRKRTRTRSRR